MRGETGFPQSGCLWKVVGKVRTEGRTRGTTGPVKGRPVGAVVVLIQDDETHICFLIFRAEMILASVPPLVGII